MHLTQSYRLPKDIVDSPYASAPKSPSPRGTSQHPIMLDLGSDSESDPICCDSPHLSPHSGACTHQCPGFNVTVPEGWTPFMEWPWLEYEGMAMSMTILIETHFAYPGLQHTRCSREYPIQILEYEANGQAAQMKRLSN